MKIAFVNQRYGLEVNGGSEYYTRLMAEHMAKYHDVEILTTQAKDYISWKNEYLNEQEIVNGIVVRRFPVKRERSIKRFILMDKICRHLHCKLVERLWVDEQGPFVPGLVHYIQRNADEYDLFIFVTYLYYTSAVGIPQVRDKAVLIPTAHDEPYIYFNYYKRIFHEIRGLVYLTPEERALVWKVFDNGNVSSAVVGIGIDTPEQPDSEAFRQRYGVDGDYYIYAGRVDSSKGCGELFDYFEKYVTNHLQAQLVVIGKVCMDIPQISQVKVLGFVSEEEKYQAIAGAKALILPSRFESLSIAVLEAMRMGVPVIVNGACEVLRGHCMRSNGGGLYYANYEEFVDCLDKMAGATYSDMQKKAKEYVAFNYEWEKVESQFNRFLARI